MRLRPASGVRLHALPSDAVLFDQPGQRIYRLNDAAACIWRHLERHADPSLAAAAVAGSLGIGEATAAGYMRDMAVQWRRLGLLDGNRSRRRARPSRRAAVPLAAPAKRVAEDAAACRRCYEVLGTTVSVGFSAERLADRVHPILRHLEVPVRRAVDLAIEVVAVPKGHEIRCNGRLLAACSAPRRIAPLLNAHLFHLALRRYPHVMALHAGAVASAQGCILLPAASGNGKTTLTAALVRDGWRYMADDIVLLRDGDLQAVGVPNAMSIKSGAWKVLRSSYPEVPALAVHDRWDGKRIRYLTPPDASVSEAVGAVPVRWIVFPRHRPAAAAELRAVSAADALCRLMTHCCGLPGTLDHAQVGRLVRWIAGIGCYDLTFSDLGRAIAEIDARLSRSARFDRDGGAGTGGSCC